MLRFEYQDGLKDRFARRQAKSAAIAAEIKSRIVDYLSKLEKSDSRSAEKRVKIDISQERITVSILDEPEDLPMIKSVTADDLMGSTALEDYAFKRHDIRKSADNIRGDVAEIITSVVKEIGPRSDV